MSNILLVRIPKLIQLKVYCSLRSKSKITLNIILLLKYLLKVNITLV